jgi:class 3 adenylate cyclase
MSAPTTSRSVVAFAGHMVDAADRPVPRFPASAETMIADAIRRELDKLNPAAGVTALASGGDLLFAEDLLSRGADVHVMLPLAVPEFITASVRPAGESWVERFHKLRVQAKRVEILGDAYFQGSGTPFQLAALLIDGASQLIARERQLDPITFGLWDAKPGDGMGGAASFIGHAVQQGRRIVCIHPATGGAFIPGPEAIAAAQRHSWGMTRMEGIDLEHRLCAFLFADVKGFSDLRETQMPRFVESIIKRVAHATKVAGIKPLVLNTWGDGLLVVTESPAEVAEIALRLVEAPPADPGAESGGFTFRVGLHCGPAFFIPRDPITGNPNVYGADVNLAARIEPIATPGEVWASRPFVVMAAATSAIGLSFEEIGERELRKNSGMMRLSRIRRSNQH